jgi:endo-1,4-beta-xylanase
MSPRSWPAALGCALLLALCPAVAHAASTPLRDLAQAKGKYFGTAATVAELQDTANRDLGTREADMLTPGNDMKWDATEPQRGQFSFTNGDFVVSAAKASNQRVRGHTLVWHNQLPSWLTNGSFTPAELGSILDTHIATVAGHYKGQLYAWDVVNEPFNEDGTFRDTLWYRGLGQGYIAQALRDARAADPAAKLYVNDYNTDGVNAKSDAMYNLVRSLQQQGVPIDGVGIQAHLIIGQVPGTMRQNIERFAALGLDVAVTELDIRMDTPADSTKLATQAADYGKVADACLAVARCVGITTWGLSDKYSWIPGVFPGQGAALPFDESFQPKPAYDALNRAFGGTGSGDPGGGPCQVTYAVRSSWPGGFTAEVRIAPASAVSGWRLEFDFTAGQKVGQGWNGQWAQNAAHVTVQDAGWNATIPAGGSVTVGFNGLLTGTANPDPAGYMLNNVSCT